MVIPRPRFAVLASLTFCASLTSALQGQSTPVQQPHPHIAPIHSSAATTPDPFAEKASLRFSYPNQISDNGESFTAADRGGYRDRFADEGLLTLSSNIEQLDPWTTVDDAAAPGDLMGNVSRYVGSLVPSPGGAKEASFEIYGPTTHHPDAPHTTLVISLWSTIPTGAKKNYEYPGDGLYGLRGSSNNGLGQGPAPKSQDCARMTEDFTPPGQPPLSNIYGAYILPRGHWNPHALVYQRSIQLLEAFQLLMDARYPGWDQKPLHVVLAGASMGGINAIDMVLQRPDLFHAAHADVPWASYRRLIHLDAYRGMMRQLITGLPGRFGTGRRYDALREIQWNLALNQMPASMPAVSLLERYLDMSPLPADRDLRRPIVVTLSDEDMVTSVGIDFLPILAGTEDVPPVGPFLSGYTLRPLDTGTAVPYLEHEIRHKDSHPLGKFGSLVPAPGIPSTALHKAILAAWQSSSLAPTQAVSTNSEPALHPSYKSDPFDNLLNRASDRTASVGGSTPDLLSVDPSFASTGVGANLSTDVVMADQGSYCYAGTVDGSVVRWDPTSLDPTSPPDARSSEVGNYVYSIAINSAGDRVAAAAYKRITSFQVNASGFGQKTQTSAAYEAEYKHCLPRLLTYKELDSNSPGEELAFVTSAGGFFILSEDLQSELLHWPEPGIRGFCVDGDLASGSFTLTIDSWREHVATLALDQGVLALKEISELGDRNPETILGPMSWPGVSGSVLAMASSHGDSLQLLNADTLELESSSGDFMRVDEGVFATESEFTDVEILSTSPLELVVLRDNMLYIVAASGATLFKKSLSTLPYATHGIGLLVADITPDTGNEVLLSTPGGLALLKQSELRTTSTSFTVTTPIERTTIGPASMWSLTKGSDDMLYGYGVLNLPYRIDPVSGAPTMLGFGPGTYAGRPYPFPIYDIGQVHFQGQTEFASRPWVNPSPTGKDHDLNDFSLTPGGGSALSGQLQLATRHPDDGLLGNPEGLQRRWWVSPSTVGYQDDFWLFDKMGDCIAIGADRHLAMFWSGQDPFATNAEGTSDHHLRGAPNHLLRFEYTVDSSTQNTAIDPASVWGSGGTGPLSDVEAGDMVGPGNALDLRADFRAADNYQSLRLFRPDLTNPNIVYSAITTTGGHLQILPAWGNPTAVAWESLSQSGGDLGYGGLALAVGRFGPEAQEPGGGGEGEGGGEDPAFGDFVVFGSLYGPSDIQGQEYLHSKIGVVRYTGGSGFELSHVIDLDAIPGVTDPDFTGLGLCGLAVGDVTDLSPGNEVVATTLNGEIYVFRTTAGGMLSYPLFATIVEGAVGVANSIVIANLDFSVPGNEVYIAGTQGVYKLVHK